MLTAIAAGIGFFFLGIRLVLEVIALFNHLTDNDK